MISILIPIYNGIEFIDESVMSVINQTYEEWELIIGINGHPQNSDIYNIAKKYEQKTNKIVVYDLYNCKGKSNTLNEMLKYCKYEYIAILDVDDIWIPTKLEKQKRFIDLNYDVIGTQCKYFGYLRGSPQIPIGDISNYNFKMTNPIINSSVILKKKLCGWTDDFESVEDYALWLELRYGDKYRQNVVLFYNLDEVLVMHRIHGSSAFNGKNTQQILLNKLRNKYTA
jgi:teichuronic acid biosynthesis glycosyltransferase TuaG